MWTIYIYIYALPKRKRRALDSFSGRGGARLLPRRCHSDRAASRVFSHGPRGRQDSSPVVRAAPISKLRGSWAAAPNTAYMYRRQRGLWPLIYIFLAAISPDAALSSALRGRALSLSLSETSAPNPAPKPPSSSSMAQLTPAGRLPAPRCPPRDRVLPAATGETADARVGSDTLSPGRHRSPRRWPHRKNQCACVGQIFADAHVYERNSPLCLSPSKDSQ